MHITADFSLTAGQLGEWFPEIRGKTTLQPIATLDRPSEGAGRRSRLGQARHAARMGFLPDVTLLHFGEWLGCRAWVLETELGAVDAPIENICTGTWGSYPRDQNECLSAR